MSWLAAKQISKKVWLWLKTHWQIPFLVVWSIIIYTLSRRNSDAIIEVMQAREESYKKQLEILRSTHNNELLKRDKLEKGYQDTMDKLEKDHNLRTKELSEKQKNEIKEVVIESKGDPDIIKQRIEEEFGFKYVE